MLFCHCETVCVYAIYISCFFQDCLPDCEETHYTATVSSAPFRSCDHKNLGLTSLCNINGEDSGGMAAIDPPIWGADVINQYREGSL